MKQLKNKKTEWVFRYLSFVGLIMSVTLRLVITGKFACDLLILDLSVAGGVLLIPVYGKRKAGLYLALCVEMASLMAAILFSAIGESGPLQDGIYALLLSAGILHPRISCIRRMADNLKSLSVRVSGWETLQLMSQEMYAILLLASTFLAVALPPRCAPFMTILMLVLYLLLVIRSFYDNLSDELEHRKSVLKKMARDNGISVRVEPEDVGIQFRVLFSRMTEYMENEKPYLSENFTIDAFAREMGTNRNYLSKVINGCTKLNFNQYVNEYRIRHAVELFKSNRNLKISDMAHMSGFRSVVTFNMAFKLFMNTTPGEWCKQWVDELIEMARRSSWKAQAQ